MVAVAGDVYQLNLEGGNSNVLLLRYGEIQQATTWPWHPVPQQLSSKQYGGNEGIGCVSTILGLGCGR